MSILKLIPLTQIEFERILKEGTGKEAVDFASCCLEPMEIKSLSTPLHDLQARVLAVGTAADMLQFAKVIPSADVEALQARAQALGFNGLDEQRHAEFDALLAAYRAQRQQQAAGHQVEVDVAEEGAGAAPEAPVA